MSKREAPDGHPELMHPSTKRAKEIDASPPYEEVRELLESQKDHGKATKVLHWFRSGDMRIQDNRALNDASETAKDAGVPLLCAYVHCPAELIWHGRAPARIDFMLETLKSVQAELKKLDIPLVFLIVDDRDEIVPSVLKFIKDNSISHVFANYEYEIDELRRDINVLKEAKDFRFALRHDQTVIEPMTMVGDSGKPLQVFTPYHHAWNAEVKQDPSLLDTAPEPSKNSASAKKELWKLFDSKVPNLPKEKQFESKEERERLRKLWPAGHDAGIKRMEKFMKIIDKYAATRSDPSKESTSRMSPYFATGAVSVREALQMVKDKNDGSSDFTDSGADKGVFMWVREVVFRELYRQTLLHKPHIAMNMTQNLKFQFVDWLDDEENYKKWEEGTTGYPFVDAGMRQINHEAYMHNRLRMNVSSFLYCNLLIDPQRGERYFAEKLIDHDLANNRQGWEPSYTVFNPVSQAEKNDPNGDYIRKWIPELKDVEGKAIFDPYNRLSKEEFKKLKYPEPCVDWKESKARALDKFKSDMKDADP